MTSLFATGYGIYKDFYGDMSDMEFGEMFSAGIAQSVKQFKTTGSGMAQSIQTLGASATTANVPLEEQLSILGMLQATMGGAEAGTKYKAFLRSAAKGGEALGLSFTDATISSCLCRRSWTSSGASSARQWTPLRRWSCRKPSGTRSCRPHRPDV